MSETINVIYWKERVRASDDDMELSFTWERREKGHCWVELSLHLERVVPVKTFLQWPSVWRATIHLFMLPPDSRWCSCFVLFCFVLQIHFAFMPLPQLKYLCRVIASWHPLLVHAGNLSHVAGGVPSLSDTWLMTFASSGVLWGPWNCFRNYLSFLV